MGTVGYQFLRESLGLNVFAPERPAMVKPVTRVEPTDGFLAIPRNVAPESDDPIEHILFALKHEGVDLQILAEALPKVEPSALLSEARRLPSGTYIRVACHLWEQFTGKQLTELPEIAGPTAELFDPRRYVTGPPRRDARWRVAFNGLGTVSYCPTIRRTDRIEAAMRSDILGRTKAFADALGKSMLDRALAWAYLHETEDSFAIERETPSEDKARKFVALLHQAHDGRALSENYLVELQNSVLTNPYDMAAAFRTEQNWLRGPARGAAGVTYVPPPPAMV
ncbi:filamentation induced by cAMP protein Fic, partial [mine drainage metagenome]